MTKQAAEKVGDNYVLPTGKSDAARLDLLHAVYGPVSLRGLEAAGPAEGMRACDIGCGTGTVTRVIAAKVGKSGHVTGVDIAQAQIDIAQAEALPVTSASIEYKVGSAYEPPVKPGSCDVVFCRLVLCHLTDPAKAVAQMASLLKPGGRLVLVDMDLLSAFTMPPSEHYEAWRKESSSKHGKNIGVDYQIGLRLHELMQDANLQTIFLAADQPLFNRTPEKHLWEKTWRNALPSLAAAGTMSQERGEEILAGMARHTAGEDVWVAMVRMFAAVGLKKP